MKASTLRLASVVTVLLVSSVALASCDEVVTVAEAESPDGRYTARVVAIHQFIGDRNLYVELDEGGLFGGEERIFVSPDELVSEGERLWWSADSRYLLLTGRQLTIIDRDHWDQDSPYFVYDLEEGTYRTDARDHRGPRIDHQRLRDIEWVGSPPLRPDAEGLEEDDPERAEPS